MNSSDGKQKLKNSELVGRWLRNSLVERLRRSFQAGVWKLCGNSVSAGRIYQRRIAVFAERELVSSGSVGRKCQKIVLTVWRCLGNPEVVVEKIGPQRVALLADQRGNSAMVERRKKWRAAQLADHKENLDFVVRTGRWKSDLAHKENLVVVERTGWRDTVPVQENLVVVGKTGQQETVLVQKENLVEVERTGCLETVLNQRENLVAVVEMNCTSQTVEIMERSFQAVSNCWGYWASEARLQWTFATVAMMSLILVKQLRNSLETWKESMASLAVEMVQKTLVHLVTMQKNLFAVGRVKNLSSLVSQMSRSS